jgi:hypothetical protein
VTSCCPGLPQHRGWCCSARDGGVVSGMAAQGRWRWRRHASLVQHHDVVLCERETGGCTLFEGSTVLFRGCGVRAVREWAAQCHGVDTSLTAQCRTVAGMALPGGLAKQRRDMISKRCQRDGMSGIRSLLGCPRRVRALNAPVGGVGAGAADPREPRAWRRPAQGGIQPSSEVETRPRGRPALERGEVSPEGASNPRAR